MKLTERKAIEICVELWTFLAKTGKLKHEWNGWEKYGQMCMGCPFCEYSIKLSKVRQSGCNFCPYHKRFGACMAGPFRSWLDARTTKDNKRYAREFLAQLRQL